MSVRAYRLIRIETEQEPSFNLSREYDTFYNLGNENDDGIFTLDVPKLRAWLKTDEAKKRGDNSRLDADLAIADANGEDYIEYYTY